MEDSVYYTLPLIEDPKRRHDEGDGDGWLAEELRKQLQLAAPMIAVNFLDYSLLVVSMMFVGHLGELPLASAALASSFAAMTGLSLLEGMGIALETLCGQAFGAGNHRLVGLYLQRGVLVLSLTALPLASVWYYMGAILTALGQSPEIAFESGQYARCLIPSLFAYAALQPLVKFLQAQSLAVVMALSSLATLTLVHIPLCYLLTGSSVLGFRGAAVATSVSNWVNVAILAAYVRRSPCWTGFSPAALQGLWQLLALAVPSAVMACLEYWSLTLWVIFSGLQPNPLLETSALSICLMTSSLMYMIPYGLGAATSTRIGNELGAGNPHAAGRTVAVSLSLATLEGCTVFAFLFSVRNWWGWLFTSDSEVAVYVTRLFPMLATLASVNAIQAVLLGVVRGGGWQAFAAVANLGSYYGVGLPIGLTLAFAFRLNDLGFWLGMSCGTLTQAAILAVATARTDWAQQARDAVTCMGGSEAVKLQFEEVLVE